MRKIEFNADNLAVLESVSGLVQSINKTLDRQYLALIDQQIKFHFSLKNSHVPFTTHLDDSLVV